MQLLVGLKMEEVLLLLVFVVGGQEELDGWLKGLGTRSGFVFYPGAGEGSMPYSAITVE